MEKFSRWLASLFRINVVWIDKGHGQWVKRRRYHPVAKAIVFVAILSLVIYCGRSIFNRTRVPETKEPNEISQNEIIQQPEALTPRLKMTDFPEEAPPGPIPDSLNVVDDEYWIRVSKSRYKLYLYLGQNVEKTYEVAVGKNHGDKERAGDNKTPVGIFTVQSIEDSHSWTHDFRDGKGKIRGAYGPWFIRLRTEWKGIGIHGTHDPDSLGSMISEGCIRMHNSELEELKEFVSIKMNVVIEE